MTATRVCWAPSCRSRSIRRRSRSCAATIRRRDTANCRARSVRVLDVLGESDRQHGVVHAADRRARRGPPAASGRPPAASPSRELDRQDAQPFVLVHHRPVPTGHQRGAARCRVTDRPSDCRTACRWAQPQLSSRRRPAPTTARRTARVARTLTSTSWSSSAAGATCSRPLISACMAACGSEVLPEDDPVGPPLGQRPRRLQRDGRRGQHDHRPPAGAADQGAAGDDGDQVDQRRTR